MDMTFTIEALAGAALIFGLRVFEMTLGTLRILYVMRGRKILVWILGFLQAAIFVVAIGPQYTTAKISLFLICIFTLYICWYVSMQF